MIKLDDSAEVADGSNLRVLMHRSVGGLDAPTDRLHPTAVTRGNHLRRRRQGLFALGGLVAAATVTALVLPAVGGGNPASTGTGFANDPSPTQPQPTLTTEPGVPVHGFWDMPAQEMLDRLAPLLPAGVTITDSQVLIPDPAPGQSDEAFGWLRVELTREGVAGVGSLELMLWGPERGFTVVGTPTEGTGPTELASVESGGQVSEVEAAPVNPDLTTCPQDEGTRNGTCTQLRNSAGEPVGTAWDESHGSISIRAVTRAAEDGYVYLASANSVDDKWGPGSTPSADEPLLAMSELRTVAASATWTD